ncbi:Wzz/FepE/Etk N-terminal domain-containing protein [Nocardiopsis sp. RSe5-2]|uniref:Wzz/FepE/Etk N-terminal domain-containing protein n=1 Tax=Nocardiopsis endophytica TaxID=3018445 RepID=A0ABT4U2S7_9ACTN|nr:Wzz/FepE/Etk N-terminal domain-containing protein [Nocardiopsis endophytica]MDA2811246.1 Wzz/FepE/Etk N-terminal domain-containing protein [Nocardiopsis endophytica]
METSAAGPDLKDCAQTLRRRWRAVAAATAAGLAIAGAGLALAPRAYTATTAVQVRPTGVAELTGELSGRTNGEVNLDTEAQVVASARVASAAGRELGGADPASMRERVEVEVPPNSSVLEISYTAPTPEAARDGATAFSDAYLADRRARVGELIDARLAALDEQTEARTEDMEELAEDAAKGGAAKRARAEARLEAVQSEISDLNAETGPLTAAKASLIPGQVLTPAALPDGPASPQPVLWLAGGGMLGLAVGAGAAFALERRARGRAGADAAVQGPQGAEESQEAQEAPAAEAVAGESGTVPPASDGERAQDEGAQEEGADQGADADEGSADRSREEEPAEAGARR